MLIEDARKIFEVHVEEFSAWQKRPHRHNFFELVYVAQGRGYQCINLSEFEYCMGNVFLLPPMDCHSFKIIEPSRFFFIRFTDHYFLSNQGSVNYKSWFDKMAYILTNYNKVPGDIISTDRERVFIAQTIQSIHEEYLSADTYSDSIITGVMTAILNILARSIEKQYVEQANTIDSRFGELLRYVNTNISQHKLLRIPALSEKFGISPTYFSEYFKKHAEMGLAEYITRSKLKLAQTQLLHTDLTLKEIAYQLDFTDSSHLSRAFKKVYGMTIKEFKQSGKTPCE